MYGPLIHGEGASLAPPAAELVPVIRRWLADTEVTRYLDSRFPASYGVHEEWLESTARSDTEVYWSIVADGTPIGLIWIKEINWRNRNGLTGIMIGEKSEWDKGHASEAMRLRTRFAFDELNLEKLMSEVFAENAPSVKALEKAGYKQYGLRRRDDFRNGRWQDVWLGELLRDEWVDEEGEA